MELISVTKPLVRLYNESFSEAEDEVMHGWRLGILEETKEGYKVRTHYGYEAYLKKEDAGVQGPEQTHIVKASFLDVLPKPKVQALPLVTLPRGSFLTMTGADENGYVPVVTADGREGFAPGIALMKRPDDDGFFAAADKESYFLSRKLPAVPEAALRNTIADMARMYLGTQYRWGGKTPAGIDCSGLAFMAYLFSGVLIYRNSQNNPRYPVKQIPKEQIRKGDLMYFPGHVAVYLGNGEYVHATAYRFSCGCCINSLDKKSPLYRPDLVELVRGGGTLF